MKMRYQRWSTIKRIARRAAPAVPVLVAVLLVAANVHVPAAVSGTGVRVATPLWAIRDSLVATVVATYESLESKEALVRENIALHNELSAMRRENFMARMLERENDRLRELAGRASDDGAYVAASVLNSELYAPYDTFMVDAGTAQGIGDGMLVVTPEGHAIGAVIRTLESSAVVQLFTAPGVRTDVVVEATSSVTSVIEGMGGGTALLTIPRDLAVEPGAIVTVPRFGGSPVGTVSYIDMQPEDAYQKVYVESAENMYELRYVLVDTRHLWQASTQAIVSTENADSGEQ